MTIKANNPSLRSWIKVNKNSDFPIQNIPFGIFKAKNHHPRVGIAIGDQVLDLFWLAQHEYFRGLDFNASVFENNFLNDFISLGKLTCRAVRERISELLAEGNTELCENKEDCKQAFYNMSEVEMLLPVKVGDYTDFYSSIDHATNVGTMFRDPANALLPNWKHLPVAYHGRSSSITISGTNFHRPKGQSKAPDASVPSFGATKQLDFELELAFIIGKETKIGDSISTENADEHIFGMVLFNDWSARDIQAWEYVPLGPFLAKNFASTISPWVVTLDALEPFLRAIPH
jgi:fumarylacetoacetase